MPMNTGIGTLIERAGPALVDDPPRNVQDALADLLKRRNGFYAFESALHVFPDRRSASELGLVSWNEPSLWRVTYGDLSSGYLFFAEDVFGGQFSVARGGVYAWDPETGEAEFMARDVETWADVILGDYPLWTGHPVARAWQRLHGSLRAGERLVPIVSFILGGEYEPENVRSINAVKAMRIRAGYAARLRDIPDGAQVRISYGP